MAEHSPGPWEIIPAIKPGKMIVRSKPTPEGYGLMVCEVYDSEEHPAIHDARLIAAAPRMYNYIVVQAKIGSRVARSILEEISGTFSPAATTEND